MLMAIVHRLNGFLVDEFQVQGDRQTMKYIVVGDEPFYPQGSLEEALKISRQIAEDSVDLDYFTIEVISKDQHLLIRNGELVQAYSNLPA